MSSLTCPWYVLRCSSPKSRDPHLVTSCTKLYFDTWTLNSQNKDIT